MRRLLAVLGLAVLAAVPSVQADNKPNVVFIYIDDLGWRDVGCMGSEYYETPHVDKLATQGMLFTNAYACAPNCAPSRACLMSGMYGPRHGIYTVGSSERGQAKHRKLIPIKNTTVLAEEFITLAEALNSAGYATASLGKWHLGKDPTVQGFDVNRGGGPAGSPRGYFSPYKNKTLPDGPKGEYLTDRLTDEAVQFIESNKAGPFFLYLTHFAVHTPIQAKQDLIAKYKQKQPAGGHDHPTYAAMIDSTDQSVGRVLAKLDELKLADKTIVIFYSDNGGYGPATSMEPLRGSKGMLYEGGIRVPLIVRWPGQVQPGSHCDVPVIGVDFYPTLLEAVGAAPAEETELDGVSLLPLLKQSGQLERDALYWHFPAYLQGYSDTKGPWRTTPAAAVRQGDWKLIEFFEDNQLELYNLKDDIGETKNLASEQPERARRLHQLMLGWRQRVNAPVPTEKNPKYEAAQN